MTDVAFKRIIAWRNFVLLAIYFACAYFFGKLDASIWIQLLVFFIYSLRLLLQNAEWLRCSRATYYFLALIFFMLALVDVLKKQYTFVPFYLANSLFYLAFSPKISLNETPEWLVKKV